jgi:methenyltetrahydromethanopterin cyclohydrolase
MNTVTQRAIDEFALNDRAWDLADEMAAHASEWRVHAYQLGAGTRVIDAGIEARGGYGAGLAMARICMGGLGDVSYHPIAIGGDTYPGVAVWTDQPAISCMASQYAGWAVKVGGFFGMGSGPLRAHARVEHELFAKLGYAETAHLGVLVLETRAHPTEQVAAWLAERSSLDPSRLTLVVAPTASIAGGVQIAARSLETGLHKMDALGFDVTRVVSGSGTAPIAPVSKTDILAIGRTNDCILYGAEARYVVDAGDDELARLASDLPAEASRDYGTPFYDIFTRYNNDFYKIDPKLFSPAVVWLTSLETGRTFHAGQANPDVLRRSLFG